MTTLVIHASSYKVQQEDKKSFERTVADRLGVGYAIDRKSYSRLYPGCDIIVLDKDKMQRAEGKLLKLVEVDKTKTGMRRYDVYIEHLRRVPYKPEALLRWGIVVID